MLREKAMLLRRATILLDSVLIYGSYQLTSHYLNIKDGVRSSVFGAGSVYATAGSMLVVACLYFNGVYGSMRRKGYPELVKEVTLAYLQAFGTMAAALFLFSVPVISRQAALGFVLCSAVLVLFRRVVFKAFLSEIRVQGYNFRTVLVVGVNSLARDFVKLLEEYGNWGLQVLGYLARDENSIGRKVRETGYPIIGAFENLDFLLKTQPIDEVVFAASEKEMPWHEMRKAMSICEEYGVRICILPKYFNMRFAKMRVEELGEFKMVSFAAGERRLLPSIVKRAIDTTVSAAALLLLSPLMVFAAVMVKLDSPGPVLFRQKRSGLNGRVFELLKFRSMRFDAERQRDDLAGYNAMSGPAFKMRDDPRVTRVGRWLRKYSIDELPQLLNVLRGDMSLVGPRPPIPSEVEKYERWQRRRLSVRPGITCLWQVSGRNEIGFEDWVRLDLQYIDNWSLKMDLELMLKTIPAVIKGTGM